MDRRLQPDVLAPDLDVIFCGLNPASSAVSSGYSFSHPSNRFWAVLHLAGFTDKRLRPENQRDLLKYRCGMTAVVQRPTRQAIEVSAEEFRRARPDFEAKMFEYAPRVIAFLGKRAYSLMSRQAMVVFGPQPRSFAGTLAWVLPNPSGLNRRFTIDALESSYRTLRSVMAPVRRGEIGMPAAKPNVGAEDAQDRGGSVLLCRAAGTGGPCSR